ncbi:hypothetical protein B0T17DRAFT_119892 [Bombardia bombarda]|uniref:Heterokaryon incompatibility domain-containing protein n=1 Tax=Bombardia bombarda TaxID=252184 RepID=A0AA39W9V6_9PEZI|nr:hypothetical protein B0T17DRAFT_119892 [Bombardia bombarda]
MEHLAIPRNPIQGHPTIPLATKLLDDGGPFLSFDERHGSLLTGNHPNVPTQADALAGRFTASVSSQDILNYHQGWLFFSLIREFLGDELYDITSYVEVTKDENDEITDISLSTRTLRHDLAKWRTDGKLALIRRGDDYHKHLEQCLDMANSAFDRVEGLFPGFTLVEAEQMLCLAALCETLDSAVATAVDNGPIYDAASLGLPLPPPKVRPIYGRHSFLSKVSSLPLINPFSPPLRSSLVAAGWCPADISRFVDNFNTIASFYYFTRFRPPTDDPSPPLHTDCPHHSCTLYVPSTARHMSPDCQCPGMIDFDEPSLIDIYASEGNNIPCFTIGRLEDDSIGVALSSISLDPADQLNPENHYVALSHVWSEGMGNPHANSLPFCQLSYVQYWAMQAMQVVESAEKDLASDDGDGNEPTKLVIERASKVRSINIWLDTMCCPSTPGYGKNLCLAKMRDIYAHACAVLVRSTTLESLDIAEYLNHPERGVMDVAATLYVSPWMRRMWTLQEGVLAGRHKSKRGAGDRLVLGYDGGVMSLMSLVNLLKEGRSGEEAALAFDTLGKFSQLGSSMWSLSDWSGSSRRGDADEEEERMSPSFFFFLWHALKFRSVSVLSDEVICLATLLGLSIGKTHDAVPLIGNGQTVEEGMCELWRRIEAQTGMVPKGIVFSTIPRVEVDGFRWAPRTLIQHAKYGELDLSIVGFRAGRIGKRGLEARFKGARLAVMGENKGWYGRYLLRKGLKDEDGDEDEREIKRDKEDRETERTKALFVQMPPGGDLWYAVRIHQIPEMDEEPAWAKNATTTGTEEIGEKDDGEVKADTVVELVGELHTPGKEPKTEQQPETPTARPDPYELVKAGNAALIFKGEDSIGQGLLVTITEDVTSEDSDSPIYVRTEYPVTFVGLTASTCHIASQMETYLARFHAAVNAEADKRGGGDGVEVVWKDDGLILQLLRQTARDMVAESDELKTALLLLALTKKSSATDEMAVDTFVRHVDILARAGGIGSTEIEDDEVLWCID